MTIGLVIVIGVSSLYLSSSGVSRTANQVSTIEQAGQLVLLVIGDSLKMAGYGEIRGSNITGRGATLMDGAYLRGCTGTTFARSVPAIQRHSAADPDPARLDLQRAIVR